MYTKIIILREQIFKKMCDLEWEGMIDLYKEYLELLHEKQVNKGRRKTDK